MSGHEHPEAVGGPLLDRTMKLLLAIFAGAVVIIAYRFFAGVGAVSAMNDGFTWGIWEPLNVVVFTGIGAGALGTGVLTYVLNRGEYHALVRPAVLLGAIAYTLGGTTIMIALGRYWNALMLPVIPFWNLSSALLEVAVCVMVYICVLWIEVLPSLLDGGAESRWPWVARLCRTWGRRLDRAMPYVIALAVVLPVMHQSSLGGLMLIAESKVHPLWHTALLPLLFLVSCLSMGYGAVVVLVTFLNVAWDAERYPRLFASMSRVNSSLLFVYVALRLGDIAWNGKLGLLRLDGMTLLFVAEIALFLVPAIMFRMPTVQRNPGRMFAAALLAVTAGAAYRLDTYITAYRPAPGWRYFPSLGEIAVTIGMAAIGIALFIFISRLFPVIVLRHHEAHGKIRAAAG
jgi:Ni/Fe-hydrogenase subunit HybB-like protein